MNISNLRPFSQRVNKATLSSVPENCINQSLLKYLANEKKLIYNPSKLVVVKKLDNPQLELDYFSTNQLPLFSEGGNHE